MGCHLEICQGPLAECAACMECLGPEERLRAMWDRQGIPKTTQGTIIEAVTRKAAPGARVGPFTLPGGTP